MQSLKGGTKLGAEGHPRRIGIARLRNSVAYMHGDSHYFRVDKPFLNAKGRRLENFARLATETFGENAANGNNDAQWEGDDQCKQPRGVRIPSLSRPRIVWRFRCLECHTHRRTEEHVFAALHAAFDGFEGSRV